jgi:ribosomal protein S18 acetylase RimI-like enzyme
MIFEPYTEKNSKKTRFLLSKIGPNAEYRFKNRSNTKSDIFFVSKGDVIGLFSIFKLEEVTEFYISFIKDPLDEFIIEEIKRKIIKEIDIKPNNNVYASICGYNTTIAELFSHIGFNLASSGLILQLDEELTNEKKKSLPKKKNYTFKPFQDEDVDNYLHLLDLAFEELLRTNNRLLNPHMSHKDHFQKKFTAANKRGDFITLWKENVLIGIYIIEDRYIDYLAIHPNHQSQGLGSLLLNHCITTMKEKNPAQEILVTVQGTNENAIRFYYKNSFVEYSRFIEYNYMR